MIAKVKILKFFAFLLYVPVVIAQGSFVQLGPISSGENKHGGSIRLRKKPALPANDIAERLALYSSGTIFLRGTITFPSSALINLGTVKAGRRIYDLVTKGKTNLSTTWIKELIARSKFNQTITESALSRKAPVNGRQLSRWFLNNGNADAMARWVI